VRKARCSKPPRRTSSRVRSAALLRTGEGRPRVQRTRGATVNAQVVLHFGRRETLFGNETVGSLAVDMLERGAANMTRQEIHDAFRRLKSRVSFGSSGPGTVVVKIETTRREFSGSPELVANVLRHPSFPGAEFEQLKNSW